MIVSFIFCAFLAWRFADKVFERPTFWKRLALMVFLVISGQVAFQYQY